MDTNVLYYGDNLKILREHIPDDSIDLIYLDPPFNSNASYNVLFKEPSGKSSEAQITAFEDTWHWGVESERTLLEINNSKLVSPNTKDMLNLLTSSLGRNDMMAYLVMMCIRIVELRRVLKDTGSIYLHCDPTASHYIKLIMDGIFGQQCFRNEVVWQRTNSHNAAGQYGRVHDILLFYTKGTKYTWNATTTPYSPAQAKRYHRDEQGRLYTGQDLTASRPDSSSGKFKWRGTMPSPSRGWGYSEEQLEKWWTEGKILTKRDGTPRMDGLKVYLDEMPGKPLQSVWTDISRIANTSSERLGYPTQKPITLLERIIQASSNENDIVLDPFCGCGTAIIAAQKLNRKWIGIDVTHLAIGVMKYRLNNIFPNIKFIVKGEPEDLEGAKELARQNKYEFQWWAVSKIGGQPYGDKKKGADTGIDGYLYFTDYTTDKNKVKKAIISVKAGGQVHSSMIRDLGHVIDREKADFGIFITLEKPTEPMVKESATKGFYSSQSGNNYPRIQILTVEDIMQGKKPNIPMWIAPIQPPPVAVKVEGKTVKMF
jgi:adenine specific DNA methylase Mod